MINVKQMLWKDLIVKSVKVSEVKVSRIKVYDKKKRTGPSFVVLEVSRRDDSMVESQVLVGNRMIVFTIIYTSIRSLFDCLIVCKTVGFIQ